MKIKNAKFVAANEIILDYEHPEYGWIPYTAIPDSGEELMQAIWDEASKNIKSLKIDVDIVKSRILHKAYEKVSKDLVELESKYSSEEKTLWETKRREAEVVKNGGESLLLESEAELLGISLTDLVDKILKKNTEHNILVNKNIIEKKKINKDFESIKNEKDINKFIKLYEIEL